VSTILERSALERVGPTFTTERMLDVRINTRAAIHEIAAAVKPGMVEEDAVDMAKKILAGKKMLRGWHPVYVRFGTNTIKTFGAPSEPGVVLGDNDIFLIDIGPVFEQWEGDGGDTFIVGNAPEFSRCAQDARTLFHRVRRQWLNERVSGKRLYEYAAAEAVKLGWVLNMDLSGHRLSDFPHAAVYDGPLADVEFSPSPLLWVLEIHIRHADQPYGAFYEDTLLEDAAGGE
jgi:Metallopeptidase family M24